MTRHINLALLPEEHRKKLEVDLHASSIAYKERYGMAVNYHEVERLIPEIFKSYFSERVSFYRSNPYHLKKYESHQ